MLNAFLALSNQRQVGWNGYQPISMADMAAFYAVHPLGEFADFCAFMAVLDRVFLTHFAPKKGKGKK